MVKINKLLNEPYIPSEYIKDVFLNPKLTPSDVTMYSADVIANHLASAVVTQGKSNFRFLMNNYSRQQVEDNQREELILSVINELENNFLFQIYREFLFTEGKKNSGKGFDGIKALLLLKDISREDFDKLSINKKVEMAGYKELENYTTSRDVSSLIEFLKHLNQVKRGKDEN